MSKWFRWYEATTEDGKFRVVARNASVTVATVIGVWAVLLEDAAHPDHRGLALRGEEFYGAVLDIDLEEVEKIIGDMQHAGLLTKREEGIEISKWKERQFETDGSDPTNADRQRRFREKHKTNKQENVVTPLRNDGVTAGKRPDTDTDTDKKEFRPKRTKHAYSEDFENKFWETYPRTPNMSKQEAWREWQKLDPDDRLLACKAIEPYRRFLQSKPDLETIHACRFLSKRRFDGFNQVIAPPAFDIRKHLV